MVFFTEQIYSLLMKIEIQYWCLEMRAKNNWAIILFPKWIKQKKKKFLLFLIEYLLNYTYFSDSFILISNRNLQDKKFWCYFYYSTTGKCLVAEKKESKILILFLFKKNIIWENI